MANEVQYYDSAEAITTVKATIMNLQGTQFNTLQAQNETDLDVIITFGVSNNLLVKSGDKILQPFACAGAVSLSVGAGSTTGNFFIQVSRG